MFIYLSAMCHETSQYANNRSRSSLQGRPNAVSCLCLKIAEEWQTRDRAMVKQQGCKPREARV